MFTFYEILFFKRVQHNIPRTSSLKVIKEYLVIPLLKMRHRVSFRFRTFSQLNSWAACTLVHLNWLPEREAGLSEVVKDGPFLLSVANLCSPFLFSFSLPDGLFYVLAHFLHVALPFSYFLPLPPSTKENPILEKNLMSIQLYING